ncbi:MAG: hypothetical protein CVU50_06475, partial [Candidatus Cloacimonetes bacterium HGW-Cloacimonetes-3]
TGTHRLYVRTQNSDSDWGIPQSKMFVVQELSPNEPPPSITAFRWYLDQNSSTAVTQTVSNISASVCDTLDIPLAGLSTGTHLVRIQALNANGQWGIPQSLCFDFVPINHPPVIDLPTTLTVNQNESLQIDVAPYISDPDNDELYISVLGNNYINTTINGTIVTLKPQQNWTGLEQLTFIVNDYVYSPSRDAASDVVSVTVTNPLIVDFETNSQLNNNVVAGDPQTAITFSATANFIVTSFAWDLDNDGTLDSVLPSPTYTYPNIGMVSVKLVASDGIHVTTVIKDGYIYVHPGIVVPPAVLNQNIVWTEVGGPYNITGEVLLSSGYSLTIEPNAQVNMLVDSLLVINGSINASEANFTAYGANGWGGLQLNPSASNSTISGISVVGAATGIIVNGCNPSISGVTLHGSSADRTPTVGIVISGQAQPTISNIQMTNFNTGIKALNTDAGSITLHLSGLEISRGSTPPAASDCGITCVGNYNLEVDNAIVENYTTGIVINGQNPARARARLTNVRVIKTESSTRDLCTAIAINNITNVYVHADSLVGFSTGVSVTNTSATPTSIEIAASYISKNAVPNGTDFGVKLSGECIGSIDSLFVNNYFCGIETNGNQQLSIYGNTFSNCCTAYKVNQSSTSTNFHCNIGFRNSHYVSIPSLSAIICNAVTNLDISNNTFSGYLCYLSAVSLSVISMAQNIFHNSLPISSPILLTTSTLSATYNNINKLNGVYPGTGNINEASLFENELLGDYSLNVFSPCIDAGNPANPPDPDGSIQDMGALTFDWTTAPLIAAYVCDTVSGQHPLTVQFTDKSTRNSISWSWDLDGDGLVDSTEQNPSHIYGNPGAYSASLTVSDGLRFDTYTMEGYINVGNTAPVVSLPLPDLNLPEDFGQYQISLDNHFSDINSNPLEYSFSLDSNLVSATINQDVLTINSLADMNGAVNITVTASDGFRGVKRDASSRNANLRLSVSDTFTLTITPVNDLPILLSYAPADTLITIDAIQTIQFSIVVVDIDSQLNYAWYLNNVTQPANSNEFTHQFASSGTYHIHVAVNDGNGGLVEQNWTVQSSVDNEDAIESASVTKLWNNYPNPFSAYTTIRYSLKSTGIAKVEVYNMRGQFVRSLYSDIAKSGMNSLVWDGRDQQGNKTADGLYLIKLVTPDGTFVAKLLKLKS